MEKEKLLTVVLMTIVSIACAFVGGNVFDAYVGPADVGVAMGFLFPTLVVYWISKFFPNIVLHSDRDYDDMHSNQEQKEKTE